MDNDNVRAGLWAACWNAVANASNCRNLESPTKWADEMLARFDERFPEIKASETIKP